jgi:hypothetical protein
LLAAAAAAGYLSVPTGAEFIKALMRGVLTAVSAEAEEPLGPVAQQNLTAPSEVRNYRPVSERRNDALPAALKDRAGKIDALLCRGEANSVENISEGERQGGTSDHRVLLRGTEVAASTMPAGCLVAALRENQVCGAGSGNCSGHRHDKPNRAQLIMRRLQ